MEGGDDSAPHSSRSSIDACPPELLLRIVHILDPSSILRLSRVSKSFHTLCTSDHIWRPIVLSVIAESDRDRARAHSRAAAQPFHDHLGLHAGPWLDQAKFLLPNARFLGWHMSSRPYISRVIRLSTSYQPTDATSVGAPKLALTIHADELVPHNELNNPEYIPDPPIVLPRGCVLEPSGTAYTVPTSGPGSHAPNAGLSCDIVYPRFSLQPMFSINATSGALLSNLTSSRTGVLASTLRLKLERVTQSIHLENAYLIGSMGGASGVSVGPLKGVREWLHGRGEEAELLVDGKIEGFHLQVIRRVTAPTTPQHMHGESNFDIIHNDPDVPRRRGVGINGGPAILWHGQERDPDARPGVAILRAGDGPGGMVFRLPQIPTQRVPLAEVDNEEMIGEEIVREDREDFFPIVAPAPRLSFDSPPTVDHHGDILLENLEGLWVGTFGAHGLEMGHISVSFDEDGPRTRRVKCVKVTGDVNVPSGQVSWYAMLDPADVPDHISEDDAPYLGTVNAVSNETLLRWSAYDPTDPQPGAEVPQWGLGTYRGRGQLALSGYVQPSMTSTSVTFIRSLQRVVQDPVREDDEPKVRMIDSVEEIRLQWRELGKVSVFRRVRL